MESIEPGQVLAGKFQIERVLGRGGMGVVVAAHHLQLGQLVALKFLLPEALRNPEVVERFLREGRAAVRLKSEHVGRVIDVGALDNGAPYLVMEYLDGQDLASFRELHQRLPVMQVVSFVLQACEAIAEAHALGIIHRDLKPANLFLTVRADGSPSVKVLDFGIAKATDGAEDFSLTRTATVMGSPAYMSPEQLRSAKDVDARSDIWAVGVILYELVSGRPPFAGETITELTLKVAMDAVPAMGVAVPPGFNAVVARCLEKDPARRFTTVAELAHALVPFGPPGSLEVAQRVARIQTGGTTRARSAVAPAVGAMTTLSGGAGQTVAASASRKRLGWIVGGGLAVGAAAVAIALALGGGGGGASAPRGAGGGTVPAQPAGTPPSTAPAIGETTATPSEPAVGAPAVGGAAAGPTPGTGTSATGDQPGASPVAGADAPSGSGDPSIKTGKTGKTGKSGKGPRGSGPVDLGATRQ